MCRRERNVLHQQDGTFVSGSWALNPRHIREGVLFALHERRATASYLQGVVVRVTEVQVRKTKTGRRQRRIDVLVRSTSTPLAWAGNGSGEKGLVWS